MSVALDAAAAVVTSNSVTTKALTTLTVGTGSNRALVVALTLQSTATSPTVRWDSAGTNQSMTLLGSTVNTGTGKVWLFGLVAPTSGNKTLTASWTGSSDVLLDALCVTGADQTGSTTTFANFKSTTASTTPEAVSQTSASGNYAVCAWSANGSYNAGPTPNSWYVNNAPNNFSGCGAHGAASGATVSFSCSGPGTIAWAASSVQIVQASAAAPNKTRPSFLMAA